MSSNSLLTNNIPILYENENEVGYESTATTLSPNGIVQNVNKTYSRSWIDIFNGYSSQNSTQTPFAINFNGKFFGLSKILSEFEKQGLLMPYKATLSYYIDAFVYDGEGKIYRSKIDENINNTLTDTAKWEEIFDFVNFNTADKLVKANSNGLIDNGLLNNASATLKGIIQLATQAEADNGTNALNAISPAILKQFLINQFFGKTEITTAGTTFKISFKDASDNLLLMIQGGTKVNAAPNSNNIVTLPTAFPTACFSVFASYKSNSVGLIDVHATNINSTSQITIANGADITLDIFWLAFGN